MNHTQGGAISPTQFNGDNLGYGFISDGVFSVATGDVQLTTAFGLNAAYDHLWLPNFRTSVYVAWTRYEYNGPANLAICNAQTIAAPGAISFTPAQVANGQCNNDFSWWQLGSRTQYNFTPWFYVGFDVKYEKIQTASAGTQVLYTALGGTAKPTALYTVQDQDNFAVRVRVHRDIVP